MAYLLRAYLLQRRFAVNLARSLKLRDAGDIPGGLTLEEGHARLRAKVGSILAGGAVPFVVGGGNDQSFANGSALLDHAKGFAFAHMYV